jgi:hypothetical protein
MTTLVAVFTAISALGGLGGLAAFAYVSVTRRKINAEARKLEVEPDVLISQQAMEMYDRMAKRAKDAEAKADALAAHIVELERVLREHGITPPPFRWPPLGLVSGDER